MLRRTNDLTSLQGTKKSLNSEMLRPTTQIPAGARKDVHYFCKVSY